MFRVFSDRGYRKPRFSSWRILGTTAPNRGRSESA